MSVFLYLSIAILVAIAISIFTYFEAKATALNNVLANNSYTKEKTITYEDLIDIRRRAENNFHFEEEDMWPIFGISLLWPICGVGFIGLLIYMGFYLSIEKAREIYDNSDRGKKKMLKKEMKRHKREEKILLKTQQTLLKKGFSVEVLPLTAISFAERMEENGANLGLSLVDAE